MTLNQSVYYLNSLSVLPNSPMKLVLILNVTLIYLLLQLKERWSLNQSVSEGGEEEIK